MFLYKTIGFINLYADENQFSVSEVLEDLLFAFLDDKLV